MLKSGMEMSYIDFKDFDLNKLTIRDTVKNRGLNYQSIGILYEYPDGETRGLRLRSGLLFTYGLKAYKTNAKEYFMTFLSFYDYENPTLKETEFKEVLDDIFGFFTKRSA